MSIFDHDGVRTYEPRHRPPTRNRPRPGLLLLSLVLVIVLGAGVIIGGGYIVSKAFSSDNAADYSGQGDSDITIQVAQGDSASAIAATLTKAGVVKSREAFTDAAAANIASQKIAPGTYRMKMHMKATAALTLILDPKSLIQTKVVVPEGFTLVQTLDRIAKQSKIPLAELQSAVTQTKLIGLPLAAQGRVEGFLFPATYDIPPGTTAVQALGQMTKRFGQAAEDIDLDAGAKALGYNSLQVVIIASLVEREGTSAEDFGKISRVIYNRLSKDMPLGLESTLRYILGDTGSKRVLQSQIDAAKASPYDTYSRKGLPTGPIANPGQAALEAALHPTAGDWLYFVTLPSTNKTVFTNNYNDFLTLQAQCRAEGGC